MYWNDLRIALFTTFVFTLLSTFATAQPLPTDIDTAEQAPEEFKIEFETSKGGFVITAHRKWSPKAVDRLYQLVKHNYFDSMMVYRVLPKYVVQFGWTDSPKVNRAWMDAPIPDEPVKHTNSLGTVAFARSGPNSRSNQLFINMNHNTPLDTLQFKGVTGFPPVGQVTSGFNNLMRLNGEYGNQPAMVQDSIIKQGNDFLKRRYPRLDMIYWARLSTR